MKTWTKLVIVAIAGAASVVGISWGVSESPATSRQVAGKWLGTITFGSVKLRIAFEVSEAQEGGYTASMRSIDQSALSYTHPE